MTERQLEQKLKKEVERLGGLCLKLKTPGFTGIPDRLILLPGGKVWFVEVKKPGAGKLSKRQDYVLGHLFNLGFNVRILSNDLQLESISYKLKNDL